MTKKLLCAICLLLTGPTACAETYRTPLGQIELEDGDSLVFFGDSITRQCLYTQYVEDYFYTRYPSRRLHFHNAGVDGDRCADALRRFGQDVTPFHPKYVTVLLGTNDGGYRPFDQGKFDLYEQGIIEAVEKIQAIDAIPVLMTPTMYDARAARMANDGSENPTFRHYNSVIAYYGALVREISYRRGLGFVDMYSPLNNITLEQRKKNPEFTLIKDSVHPGVAGHVVMAAAVLDALHSNALVSSIHIQAEGTNTPQITAQNGKAKDAKRVADGVTFSFLAKALPWVLPDEAKAGFELARAGQRFSREQLQATGLPAGVYRLLIDGREVGIYSHLDLVRGIELQANARTPQYRQSLGVAMINKERNEKAYKQMRDLWWTKKLMRVTAETVAAEPANQKAKAELAQLESQYPDIDSRIDVLLAKAKEYEQQIYQANQPKSRHYEIRRKD